MDLSTPFLLPQPRQLTLTGGTFTLPQNALIVISPNNLLFEGQQAQNALRRYAKLDYAIVAGEGYREAGLTLRVDSSLAYQAEGYRLSINANGVEILGRDAAGVFYGVCSLTQLLQQYGAELPHLVIEDWPDYQARGVMLDISRDKVPTLATTLALVERLASWKINQVQLYMEHTFAYRDHQEVWADASPFTGEDILVLDAFCRKRHIELIPNQNGLGHMERWLKFPRYLPLAESPDGFEPPWGGHLPPSTLNPLDPGSIQLIAGLYDELLPHFSSKTVNVGGDEPWELGKGKSKAEFEKRGGRVYLEYLLKLYDEVSKRGRKTQFWADIIVHYPELVPELPKDITAMPWGYEGGEKAALEWERQCRMMAEAGVPFYVVPGTASWNGLVGRSDNAIDNCRITAEIGAKYGATGYLITDWGDNGHWQPMPVSYLGFAYGAGASWCFAANHDLDMPRALNLFAFEDAAGVMGKLVYELGNVYKLIGPEHINGQIMAYVLQSTRADAERSTAQLAAWGGSAPDTRPETVWAAMEQIKSLIGGIGGAQMRRDDAGLIQAEFRQAADLLHFGGERLLWLQDDSDQSSAALLAELERLVDGHKANWLARNRPGGLVDSLKRFEMLRREYSE